MWLERLRRDHDRAAFSCGRPELDEWLQRVARQAQDRAETATTFVLTDDGRRVLGYFSLAAHTVLVPDVPEGLTTGLPRHLAVPSILLARLAVASSRQGGGLGTRLAASAVHHAVRAQEVVAARLLVVDAIDDEAARFYVRFGFTAWPADPPRLFARIRDLRATLAAGRPPPDVS